jgi:hypothetical protein
MRGGLTKALRRAVSADEVTRIVAEMSPVDDNSMILDEKPGDLGSGKASADTVETPPRSTAILSSTSTEQGAQAPGSDDRSEDARL